MKQTRIAWLGGAVLILAGIALLLQNLHIVREGWLWDGLWTFLFGAGALAFFWVYVRDKQQWWALIPGGALLGLAGVLGLNFISPRLSGDLGGTVFMGALALGFLLIYALHREHWWALIPGGVLASIAVMILVEELGVGIEPPAIMFLGMAATFAIVALVPTQHGRMTWAWIPAAVLLIIGLAIFTPFVEWLNIIAPVALIIGGGALLLRNILKK